MKTLGWKHQARHVVMTISKFTTVNLILVSERTKQKTIRKKEGEEGGRAEGNRERQIYTKRQV